MKTSLDLPDDLYRQLKAKCALEGRTVRDVATSLFAGWVAGRISAPAVDDATQDYVAAAPDPGEQWRIRWRELTSRISPAAESHGGLLSQLHADRR